MNPKMHLKTHTKFSFPKTSTQDLCGGGVSLLCLAVEKTPQPRFEIGISNKNFRATAKLVDLRHRGANSGDETHSIRWI